MNKIPTFHATFRTGANVRTLDRRKWTSWDLELIFPCTEREDVRTKAFALAEELIKDPFIDVLEQVSGPARPSRLLPL